MDLEARDIGHRLGIVEMPEYLPVLQRMLEVTHGPQRAREAIAALPACRFVVMFYPDSEGAGPFTTDSLADVLVFLGKRWRLSREQRAAFHYVVEASAAVKAHIERFALEARGFLPRSSGSWL